MSYYCLRSYHFLGGTKVNLFLVPFTGEHVSMTQPARGLGSRPIQAGQGQGTGEAGFLPVVTCSRTDPGSVLLSILGVTVDMCGLLVYR